MFSQDSFGCKRQMLNLNQFKKKTITNNNKKESVLRILQSLAKSLKKLKTQPLQFASQGGKQGLQLFKLHRLDHQISSHRVFLD